VLLYVNVSFSILHMNVSCKGLVRFAWLSTAAAVLTIGLKTAAYFLTGSVGLLSDALESLVNLAGGLMAVGMLTVAAQPADERHPYGHSKAEYFSSVVEGALILLAAASISVAAIHRLISPKPLEQIGIGLGISILASLVNLGVAVVLLRASKRYESITLKANAHHLLTDVWTSAGVLVGIGAVVLTGWTQLDPIVALVVAANIVWTGFRIMRDSVGGLMDAAISAGDQQKIRDILEAHLEEGAQYHALRTRQSGAQRFISFHMLVPGDWTVARGHQLIDHIETDLRSALAHVTVFSHLESLEDPAAWDDSELRS
jgi:cation diffusion facilitator family transporter